MKVKMQHIKICGLRQLSIFTQNKAEDLKRHFSNNEQSFMYL